MDSTRRITPGRLRRLTDELIDEGLGAIEHAVAPDALVEELDYALRPPRHERRVPSYGAFVLPTEPIESWGPATGLDIAVSAASERVDDEVRRYADGIASWTIRVATHVDALAVFDRGAASERDLVVLAAATGATVVQRHPNDEVRVVGTFGVARWDGVGWHVEPPVSSWLRAEQCTATGHGAGTLERLLEFAVHDLGARGIGAMFVYDPADVEAIAFERRMPPPPELSIRRPVDLGPLRHVLTQLDGAVLVGTDGTVIELGVRLVPSTESESAIDAIGGTRHTSARRYSADDPEATVVVVSEAGPVTVFRAGEIVGRSA